MTGLPDRVLFHDRADHTLRHSGEHHGAVLLIDIDGFAALNRTWGEATGDDVLLLVASRLRAALRPEDVVCRLGGDEFGVLLHSAASQEAMLVATRVHAALQGPMALPAGRVPVRTSIGVALAESAEDTSGSLLAVAAEALSIARADGGGRIAVLDPATRQQSADRRRLEAELHQAVARREFRWHYQPVVDLSTGAVKGVKALLRWQHPQRGLLAPDHFLEVVQRCGLMPELGRQMLADTCRRFVEWATRLPAFADVNLALNVSGPELTDNAFLGAVRAALADTGLPPERLVLEITETSLIVDDDASVDGQLGALRAIGVPLALDDFGTGFSSLSHLRSFPVQILKVDRSFVSGTDGVPADQRLAAGIVQLGRGMSLDVVAEGIETAEQAELLRGFGAQYGQGYFFSPPLPPDELETFMATNAMAAVRGSTP